jgi:thioredoxin 1
MSADRSWDHAFKRSIAKGVTIVDFNARWCVPCRIQTPILKALEKTFSSVAKVKIIDIERNREIAFKLGIQSVPTIIIYQDGREMNRFIGLQTGDTLGNAIKALIG